MLRSYKIQSIATFTPNVTITTLLDQGENSKKR